MAPDAYHHDRHQPTSLDTSTSKRLSHSRRPKNQIIIRHSKHVFSPNFLPDTSMHYKPITQRLKENAASLGNHTAFRILHNGDVDGPRTELTWQQIYQQTCQRAGQLSKLLHKGQRVLLLMDTGFDFITTYFACLGLEIVAVPVPTPTPNPDSAHNQRLLSIIKDCKPSATSDQHVYDVQRTQEDTSLLEPIDCALMASASRRLLPVAKRL